MDRYAILVDAGYLFAAGAHAVHSRRVPRRSISLASPDECIKSLCKISAAQTGVSSLLRIYWYDAMQGPRLSLEQTTIAKLASVKLRLGSLNSEGEQKGVDSLIVTDLIELARNRALSDAVLVSGDEDLRVAVQVAQTFGVRVHVLAVGDAATNVSNSLQMEADSVDTLDLAWIKRHLAIRMDVMPQAVIASPIDQDRFALGRSTAVPTASPGDSAGAAVSGPDLEKAALAVCKELLESVTPGDVAGLRTYFDSNKTVPPEYDRKLIAKTGVDLGRRLTPEEKRKVRGLFVGYVRKAAAAR